MVPIARCVHHIDGRTHLKIYGIKNDIERLNMCKTLLEQLQHVKSVKTNPISGSLVVYHTISLNELALYADEKKIFYLDNIICNKTMRQQFTDIFSDLDKKIKILSNGEFDTGTFTSTVLIITGLIQLIRGNFSAPVWYTAFWYAFGIITKRKS